MLSGYSDTVFIIRWRNVVRVGRWHRILKDPIIPDVNVISHDVQDN